MCFLCFPRVTTPWITQWRLYDVENCCKTSIRESVSQNTNARHLFFGAFFFVLFFSLAHFSLLFALLELKYVICSILDLKSRIRTLFAAFWSKQIVFRRYLQHFGPWTSSCLKKRSILEPAFARYCLHHVYNNLKSHIRMVLVSFWCNNMEFAWYLLQNESCSNCYLIVFYFDDSTTAAAYWHFLGFL